MKIWQKGLGAIGALYGENSPLYVGDSVDVFFVDSVTGDDANAGTAEQAPKKTLASAVAAAGANDIIVLSSTHDETIVTPVVVSSRISILGSGSSGGIPSSKLTLACGVGVGLTLAAGSAGAVLSNVRFPPGTVTGATNTKILCQARSVLDACYIEQGDTDAGYGLQVSSAGGARLTRCTFVNASTVAPIAVCGLLVDVANADLLIDQLCLDNGAHGWSAGYAMSVSAIASGMIATRVTLLNGADVNVAASSTTAMQLTTVTGNGRIVW